MKKTTYKSPQRTKPYPISNGYFQNEANGSGCIPMIIFDPVYR
ncbi:hypothetical protein ECSTECO31_0862 [Escherichia coli STEC_O31]|nr:hypothetical protein ECSTECO31_0862 [Escherichia coli STEC_O31]